LHPVSALNICLLIMNRTNGKTLFVGINENFEAAKLVKEGSIITVKHLGTNAHGTLQFPKFYRERNDVLWNNTNT
jgi:hypothetical protein